MARGTRTGFRDLGEFQKVVGRDRLFVPERVVGFELAAHADRAGGGELAVGAEEKVDPVAHRLADRLAEGDGAGDVGHRRFMAAADGVGAGGVEFDGGEAQVHEADGGLGGGVGVDPELGGFLAGFGVKVGVAADAVVHLAAQKRPDRAVARLAEDVPAGNLQPREGAHHGGIGALGETGGIGAAEHQLDVFGVFALHVAFEDILDHRAHRLWPDGRGIAFAVADDAVVGGELREDPVAPAPAGERGGDDEDFEVLQFHARVPLAGRRRGFHTPAPPWGISAEEQGRVRRLRRSDHGDVSDA